MLKIRLNVFFKIKETFYITKSLRYNTIIIAVIHISNLKLIINSSLA